MNDRFKFRGIHPVLGELQEIKFIDFIHNTVDFGDGDIFKIEEVNMQQPTGLKDKNGKLIFEGDVVKTFIDRDIVIGVIAWCDKELRYYLNTTDYFGDKYVTDFDIYKSLSYEVIGNIYENKDLLNENS